MGTEFGDTVVGIFSGQIITGAILSSTVIICNAVWTLPQTSDAVHVLVIVNLFGQLPGIITSATVTFTIPPQLSVTETESILGEGTSEELL